MSSGEVGIHNPHIRSGCLSHHIGVGHGIRIESRDIRNQILPDRFRNILRDVEFAFRINDNGKRSLAHLSSGSRDKLANVLLYLEIVEIGFHHSRRTIHRVFELLSGISKHLFRINLNHSGLSENAIELHRILHERGWKRSDHPVRVEESGNGFDVFGKVGGKTGQNRSSLFVISFDTGNRIEQGIEMLLNRVSRAP